MLGFPGHFPFFFEFLGKQMRGAVFKKIMVFAACGLIAAFLGLEKAKAASRPSEPYNSAQLKYLFSGSEFKASFGVCSDDYSAGQVTARFNFAANGTLDFTGVCIPSGADSYFYEGQVSWEVKDGEICFNTSQVFEFSENFEFLEKFNNECWRITPWKFGFAVLDYKGSEDFTMTLQYHPKHSSRQELYAALKTISGEPQLAEPQTEPETVGKAQKQKSDQGLLTEIERLKQEAEIARLNLEVEKRQRAETARKSRETEIARLIETLEAVRNAREAEKAIEPDGIGDIEFGNYHALIIGIEAYKHLPKLETAVNDAVTVARVLKNDYGFKVTLLLDPERGEIIDALDEYRVKLGPEDNLLIYYAGHGWLDEDSERGYWLPVDAKPKLRSRWVSNATITDTLKSLAAKHVMVVADSCYSGTLVRGVEIGSRNRTGDYWKKMAGKWARVAITSGGLEPVADKGGGNNSPFAKAFIDALRENSSVMDGTQLFSKMRRPVMVAADQTPQYSDVRKAGHDGGDFLFVRKR